MKKETGTCHKIMWTGLQDPFSTESEKVHTVRWEGSITLKIREIDFVVNSGGKRTYIQSAYVMPADEKAEVELRPFTLTGDSFPKIVVRKDIGKRWYDDNGILNINVIDFLLDKELI